MKVIIVGGGLAGMAAAVALESAGAEVMLLEASRRLGGRASSFDDPQGGESLDNCQHVLLGCCTNLRDFYRRTGAEHLIQWEKAIRFVDERGRAYPLSAVPGLPAPLHLGMSVLKFGALTWGERVALSRGMLAMMRTRRQDLAEISFGQWLDEHQQPAGLVAKLYEPIITSALNETCAASSAMYAIQVFQDSLLAHAGGYVMGLPACPLGKLYETLPCKDVRFGARVAGLCCDGMKVAGVELQDGQRIEADALILATNYPAAQRLAPNDERLQRASNLESVPILGAHLWFDRAIMRESHAALLSGPLQWLFRKDDEGRVLHGVISAARDWLDKPKEECLAMFERQVRETFRASEAKLLRGVVVIDKRATFAPVPGVDRFRPTQAPQSEEFQSLFLAGDYTQTGWPATMEGAVRSGYLAAEAVLGGANKFLVPDLPVQWPGKLLAPRLLSDA